MPCQMTRANVQLSSSTDGLLLLPNYLEEPITRLKTTGTPTSRKCHDQFRSQRAKNRALLVVPNANSLEKKYQIKLMIPLSTLQQITKSWKALNSHHMNCPLWTLPQKTPQALKEMKSLLMGKTIFGRKLWLHICRVADSTDFCPRILSLWVMNFFIFLWFL